MTDQPRWPRGTPGGGHAPGPGPGRFRPGGGDWADQISARLPQQRGARLAAMIPSDVDPYGGTSPEAIGDWARGFMDYTDPGGQGGPVRSEVTRWHVQPWPSGKKTIHVEGQFVGPADDYYIQGRHAGSWGFQVRLEPDGTVTGSIDNIGVDYSQRGSGIARRWVQRLEAALRAEGTETVDLYDLSVATHGGQSYWEQLGFRQAGDYGLEMVKRLL